MLVSLLALSLNANASSDVLEASTVSTPPAALVDGQTRIVGKKRDAEVVEKAVQPALFDLADCRRWTGGYDLGALTVSFEIDKRGRVDNVGVRSERFLLTPEIKDCVAESLQDLDLGRGGVAFARVGIDLEP